MTAPASREARSDTENLLAGGSLPPPVAGAWARWMAEGGHKSGTAAGLAAGWRAESDGEGGSQLLEIRGGEGGKGKEPPRLWSAGDRWGWLHLLAGWESEGLRRAWLRLPASGASGATEGLEIRPHSARHPLWGSSDALWRFPAAPEEEGPPTEVGLLPAQPYERLEHLPPFDQPARLPPGAGGAVLNLLARLMTVQGLAETAYRGPYPTPALHDVLCRSFHPFDSRDTGDPEERPAGREQFGRERFVRDELELAFRGEMALNPLRWRPAPFAQVRPRPGLVLHLRGGVDTAWLGSVPFRAPPPFRTSATGGGTRKDGGTLPGGARLWPVRDASGTRTAAGLVLMGHPWRRWLLLEADGTVVEDAVPSGAPGAGVQAEVPGELNPPTALAPTPMATAWREVIFAWCALAANPALAPAITALEGSTPLHWAPLPLALAAPDGADGFRVQWALADEFRRRARMGEDAPALAMMMISDVLEALGPMLRRAAQQRLEAAPRQSPERMLKAGARVQAEARGRLERALPLLARTLAGGKALPPPGVAAGAGDA